MQFLLVLWHRYHQPSSSGQIWLSNCFLNMLLNSFHSWSKQETDRQTVVLIQDRLPLPDGQWWPGEEWREKVKAMYIRQETSKTNHKKMSFTTQSWRRRRHCWFESCATHSLASEPPDKSYKHQIQALKPLSGSSCLGQGTTGRRRMNGQGISNCRAKVVPGAVLRAAPRAPCAKP